jgi:hypothetical protein
LGMMRWVPFSSASWLWRTEVERTVSFWDGEDRQQGSGKL